MVIRTCDLVSNAKEHFITNKKQWIRVFNFLIENNCCFIEADEGNYTIDLDHLNNGNMRFDLIFHDLNHDDLIRLKHKSYFAKIKVCDINNINPTLEYQITDYKKDIVLNGNLPLNKLSLVGPSIFFQLEKIIEKNIIKNLVWLGVDSIINKNE
jgi:hypothetical protein